MKKILSIATTFFRSTLRSAKKNSPGRIGVNNEQKRDKEIDKVVSENKRLKNENKNLREKNKKLKDRINCYFPPAGYHG